MAAFRQHTASSPAVALGTGVLVFGSIALVEELGRCGFVRNAEQPLRALVLFTIVTSLISAAIFHDHPSTVILFIMIEVAASTVLYYGTQQRSRFGLFVAANVICRTAIFIVPHSLNATG
jgi:hypothetical protein